MSAVILKLMRLFPLAGLGLCLALTTGCHSAYINATIHNQTAQPLSLVEVDYPSASFGTQTLAPGAEFHYRFKVLGSGELKLLYTDAAHAEHHAAGPHLGESDEGTLGITISGGEPVWDLKLVNRK